MNRPLGPLTAGVHNRRVINIPALNTEKFAIDRGFPGGNIVVENLATDHVLLHQELRDSHQPWFYWYFRVRGAAGKKIEFRFTQSDAVGVRGPAASGDDGKSWHWLGAQSVRGNGFYFDFPELERHWHFCFGMPYQKADWESFIASANPPKWLHRGELCRSRKSRKVEYFILKQKKEVRRKVVITCRHHSCEMMGSHVLEGFVERVLRVPHEHDDTEFLLVPFVDLDGVEDGDQGKARSPRDHNRDYDGHNLYPETAALQRLIPQWQEGVPLVCLDLHCPHIRGGTNETLYLVGSGRPETAVEQGRFSRILEGENGLLPFRARDLLPYGTSWNIPESFLSGKCFTAWMEEQPGVVLSTSIEIPYATAGGAEVNPASCRDFGRRLADALNKYFTA